MKQLLHGIGVGALQERIEKVKMRRLDDFVKDLGIHHIDFMKVDVEGAEKEVFEGGQEILKFTDNIFVEIIPLLKGKHTHDT